MTAERLWFALVQALERHGWTLLAAAALLLVARARLREFSQRAHERRALADANGAWKLIRSGPTDCMEQEEASSLEVGELLLT